MKPSAKCFLLVVFSGLTFMKSMAQDQDDLLALVKEDKPQKEYVEYAFKSSRVIMTHSLETIKPGTLDLRIMHRFGNIDGGFYELFGLDRATMRMSLDFGITKDLMIGVGRSTNKKELDGFLKYRLIHQAKGPGTMPFSLLVAGGTTLNTLKWTDTARKNYLSSRMGYYGQVLIGRKFSEGFSLQIAPTILHRNLVPTAEDPNNLFAIGIGGRLKLSRRISFTMDYFYRLNPNELDGTYNPLSVGIDIETGGHVFQLHFTNAAGMNERAVLSESINNWGDGDFQFGFNLSRTFQIKKKRGKFTK